MKRAREIGLMAVTAAMIFFAWQNLNSVEVAFLFWRFEAPLPVVVLVPLLVGLIVGAAGTAITIRKRRRREAPAAALEEATAEPQPYDAFKDAEEIPR